MSSRRSLLPFVVVIALVPRLTLAAGMGEVNAPQPEPNKQEVPRTYTEAEVTNAINEEMKQADADLDAANKRIAELEAQVKKPDAPPVAASTDTKKDEKASEDPDVEISMSYEQMKGAVKGFYFDLTDSKKLVPHGRFHEKYAKNLEFSFDDKTLTGEFVFRGKKSEWEAFKDYDNAVCGTAGKCVKLESLPGFTKSLGAKSGTIYIQTDGAYSDDEDKSAALTKDGKEIAYKSASQIAKEKREAEQDLKAEQLKMAQAQIANCQLTNDEAVDDFEKIFGFYSKNVKTLDADLRDKEEEKKIKALYAKKLEEGKKKLVAKKKVDEKKALDAKILAASKLTGSDRADAIDKLQVEIEAYAKDHNDKESATYIKNAYNNFALLKLQQMSSTPKAGEEALAAYKDALANDELDPEVRKKLEEGYVAASQALLARAGEKGPANAQYAAARTAIFEQAKADWNAAGCENPSEATDLSVCDAVKQRLTDAAAIDQQSREAVVKVAQRDACVRGGKTLQECNALVAKDSKNPILGRAINTDANSTGFSDYSASPSFERVKQGAYPVFAQLSTPVGEPTFVALANSIGANNANPTFFKTNGQGKVTGLLQ